MTVSGIRLARASSPLRAHTERLADDEVLLDHLGPGGAVWLDGAHGFVTAGVASVVAPEHAVSALRAIAQSGPAAPDGVGPRACGALPFTGGGRLVVPACIVERDTSGRVWRTTIGTDIDAATSRARTATATAGATRAVTGYRVDAIGGYETWASGVAAILALVDAGVAEKVVLAREVGVDAEEPFDIATIARLLHATQPGCIVYADGGFVGASPELLVRRVGRVVTSRPMAGTGLHADALVRSGKDAHEHGLVVDAVFRTLATLCDDVLATGPAPVELADLTHLATTITARAGDLDPTAVDLALALHPTPAVAGTPTEIARAEIARLEPTARDLYAGPCGWVDARGNGAFVVALRGAQIDGTHARLHAGAGIVAGSRAEDEWAETQAKLEPMLRVLVRP